MTSNRYRRTLAQSTVAVAALIACSPLLAQTPAYCPVTTTFFSSNYALAGCTLGTCWKATAFTGSTAISGAYPAGNYACATAAIAGGQPVENTVYGYDNNGNLTTVKDPLGRSTTNAYDALNRLTSVTDAQTAPAGITLYGYDRNGVLAQVTDPRNLVTSYAPNGFGESATLTSPDTGVTTNTYDLAGNLQTRLDARGVLATYTYDDVNRVKQIAYTKSGAPTETHTFEYDGGAAGAPYAKGRLTKITDPAAVTSYTYESHGRILSKTQTVGSVALVTRYSYNAAGQLETLTTPSGQVIGYTYQNNRVRNVTVNGATLLKSANFDPFGPLAAWSWGNGQLSARHRDYDGRIDSWQFGSPTALLKNDLTFFANSNVKTINDPANGALKGTYTYDPVDRLTQADQGNPVSLTQGFTYDKTGNRATSSGAATTNYTYATPATSNKLLSLSGGISRAYGYDAVGNPSTIGAATYTYNLANRLVAVTGGTTYKVNALGQRVQKVAGGVTTHFVYDEQGHLLGEYDGTGTLQREHVWLDDLPVAVLAFATGTPPAPTQVNFALASNGAAATASSTLNATTFPVAAIINGDRRGLNWGSGGGWADSTSTPSTDWVQIDFNGPKTLTEIDVFTVQDSFSSPAEPTLGMTFNNFGITVFTVQYWDGGAWQTVPGGAFNNTDHNVWRQFTFPALTTASIRITMTGAIDGYSRLTEVEAWGPSSTRLVNAAIGAATSAGSTLAGFTVTAVNNGDRAGINWSSGGGWASTQNNFPNAWVDLDFGAAKLVEEVDVFTTQNNWQSPLEPTPDMTFTLFGLTAFDVQAYVGGAYQTVRSITGNTNVWRKVGFPAVSTNKIRIKANASPDGWARLTEVEALVASAPSANIATYYVHPDHLGTPRAVTRPADNVFMWRWDNVDPFGANAANETISGTSFKYALRFPGQYFDAETGTHYNYFRDYDPTIGRYEQSDPIGLAGGINTYAYAFGDPISRIDMNGLESCRGRWMIFKTQTVGMSGSNPITNPGAIYPTCICTWLCVDCQNPVMISKDGLGLPTTRGLPWVGGSPGVGDGNIRSGNRCLCPKPGPESGCNMCTSDYPGPYNVQNPRWQPE